MSIPELTGGRLRLYKTGIRYHPETRDQEPRDDGEIAQQASSQNTTQFNGINSPECLWIRHVYPNAT